MVQIQYIKDLYDNEDLSLIEMSRRIYHSFNTGKKCAHRDDGSESELPNHMTGGNMVIWTRNNHVIWCYPKG